MRGEIEAPPNHPLKHNPFSAPLHALPSRAAQDMLCLQRIYTDLALRGGEDDHPLCAHRQDQDQPFCSSLSIHLHTRCPPARTRREATAAEEQQSSFDSLESHIASAAADIERGREETSCGGLLFRR